jgi:uncharacterized Zn-finger protein
MKEDTGFNLVRNNFPACPHCGECEYNTGDIRFDDYQNIHGVAIIDCPHCDREYRVWRVVDVSYTTEKIKETDHASTHE